MPRHIAVMYSSFMTRALGTDTPRPIRKLKVSHEIPASLALGVLILPRAWESDTPESQFGDLIAAREAGERRLILNVSD